VENVVFGDIRKQIYTVVCLKISELIWKIVKFGILYELRLTYLLMWHYNQYLVKAC
jgi:hypothetical protein